MQHAKSDLDEDVTFAETLSNLGKCLVKLNRFFDAKECLQKSLEIKNKILQDSDLNAD